MTTAPWSIDNCSSCGAEIVWAMTERGKRMPVDAHACEDGNLILRREEDDPAHWVAEVVSKERRSLIQFNITTNLGPKVDIRLYKSHFATCANAARHRR